MASHNKSYLHTIGLGIQLLLATTAIATGGSGLDASARARQLEAQSPPPPAIQSRQAALTPGADDEYLVGFGIADITGPSADINLVSLISQLFEWVGELLVSQPAGSYAPSFSPGRFSSVARADGRPAPPPQPPDLVERPAAVASTTTTTRTNNYLKSPPPPSSCALRSNSNCTTFANATAPRPPSITRRPTQRAPSKTIIRANTYKRPPMQRRRRKQHAATAATERARYYLLKELAKRALSWSVRWAGARHAQRAHKKQATVLLNDRPLMSISYPSWRDLQNPKLQIKVNLNNLLTNVPSPSMSPRSAPFAVGRRRRPPSPHARQQPAAAGPNLIDTIIRWAMPSQIKMQVEYTYANFVVRL
jgi:hypothetical protein